MRWKYTVCLQIQFSTLAVLRLDVSTTDGPAMPPFVDPQHLLLLKEECLMGVALRVHAALFSTCRTSAHVKE